MGMFDYRPPAMKFVEGKRQGGRVVEVQESQRRAYRSDGAGQPLFWHQGKPVEGVEVDPATGEANRPVMQTEIVVDTGIDDGKGETERTIYFGKQRMEKAFKDAARDARLRRGEDIIGWYLWVTQTGTEPGAGGVTANTWAVELVRGEAPKPALPTAEPAMAGAPALRNHESSPVLNKRPAVPDDEPPF